MLSGINAKILYVGKKRINVELNSYYFWIHVSESHKFQISNEIQKIYCKKITQISNNELKSEIYGFQTIKELEWFQALLNCQGIGPKTAIRIMKHDIKIIKNLILNKDKDGLCQLDGINANIATYLIFHNWKPWELNQNDSIEQNNHIQKIKNNDREEIISTLIVLGYDEEEIDKNLKKIEINDNYDVSDIIATLIKLMTNNENVKQLSS